MAILCASATLATHYNVLVRLQVQQPHKPIFTHPDPLLTISAYRENIIGTRAVRVQWRRADGLPRRLRLVQQIPSFQSVARSHVWVFLLQTVYGRNNGGSLARKSVVWGTRVSDRVGDGA